jgi:hypothetical protein
MNATATLSNGRKVEENGGRSFVYIFLACTRNVHRIPTGGLDNSVSLFAARYKNPFKDFVQSSCRY